MSQVLHLLVDRSVPTQLLGDSGELPSLSQLIIVGGAKQSANHILRP